MRHCRLAVGLASTGSCDGPDGFHCRPSVSAFWGQYSPYFSVPSEIAATTPAGCRVTFAQVLSRHGGRDPTQRSSAHYRVLIAKIKREVTAYKGDVAFLRRYKYTLGADQLTQFGAQQMVFSGAKFYARYRALARQYTPFIRASGQARVVDSARHWARGFRDRGREDGGGGSAAPLDPDRDVLVLPEGTGHNNTLSSGQCPALASGGWAGATGPAAQAQWQAIFAPPIRERLRRVLPGTELSLNGVLLLMDLCPFETVAHARGRPSTFCAVFTHTEWRQYDYYQSLGKYYGHGPGNALAATVGAGFVNELIARLTATAVRDRTSTNRTLDADPATFPIGKERPLFADFSHDNEMAAIFAALRLHDDTSPLLNRSMQSTDQTAGYSASWTVPFAARLYVEKLACDDGASAGDERVRVLLNDRVMPLTWCHPDPHATCSLRSFVDGLDFARKGGRWDECSK